MNRKTVKPPSLVPDLGEGRILWTAGGIARRLGCSPDFVRMVLATAPGSPIRRIGGKIYAFEDDLILFLRDPNRKQPTKPD